jgi:hypothetical protein
LREQGYRFARSGEEDMLAVLGNSDHGDEKP